MMSLRALAVISTLLLSAVTATPLAAAPCYGYNCPPPKPVKTITTTLKAGAKPYTSTRGGTVYIGKTSPPKYVTKYITKTSYLSSGKGYTSTKGTTVIIGIPVKTVTKTLPAGGKPFTSTRPGTVIIGVTTKYTTKTTFLPTGGGFTSTKGATVVVGVPVKTFTTTIPAGGQPFTSTRPGTVIIGKPSTFTTTTTYLSTGEPEFTSTSGGTVVIGKDVTFTTTTASIPAGEPGFTSTIPPVGSVPGTVIIGQPSTYTTTTTYLSTGEPEFTSTIGGTVVIGKDVTFTTTTASIPAGEPGFTSTIPPAGSVPGTVIIGQPSDFVTTTSFLQTGPPFTSTTGGTVVVGFPQTTTTETVTSGTVGTTVTVPATGTVPGTVIVTQPTPVECGNQGFEYALYHNPYLNEDLVYSTFDPGFIKNTLPYGSGVTTHVGLSDNGEVFITAIDVYDYPLVPVTYLALNHRGYLFAKISGTYTFSTPGSDDITILWVGLSAMSFTKANAAINQPYIQAGAVAQTYTVILAQGSYTPIRLIWANAQERAFLGFTITAPDGTTIISSDTLTPSPYLVKFSCDGSAPSYPPFGQEG